MVKGKDDFKKIKCRKTGKTSLHCFGEISILLSGSHLENTFSRWYLMIVFNKFTGSRGKSGSNDANAEYLAKIRNAMDAQAVAYQFAELGKVDAGGGGTIAYIMANYGMEVIDSGVAVLSMHAPWEVTSKADVYEAYKGYRAFIEEM